MPSNIQGIIQTILQMRELQIREAAQRLAEQQIGISTQNAQGGALAGFQSLIQNSANPAAFAPYAGQMAQRTGLPSDFLSTMISQTPASAAATRGRALQSGAEQLGGSQDVAAATQELTGMTPGQAARDRTASAIFEHVPAYLQGLPPEDQQRLSADIVQQLASGQDVGSAAMSRISADFISRAPQEVRDQIVKIGRGLAPGASEESQLQLGYARYRLDERQTEMQLGFEDLRTQAALREAASKMDKGAFDATSQLVMKRSEFLTDMARRAATQTLEGRLTDADQLNAFNEQLRQIAPDLYGPKGTHPLLDLPRDKSVSATGFLPFLSQHLSKPR